MFLLIFLLLPIGQVKCNCLGELLSNSDLEEDTFTKPKGWNKWDLHTSDSRVSLSTDSHTGNYSAHVTHRKNTWSGLGQDVVLEAGKNYVFSAYIKLLNTPRGKSTAGVNVMLKCQNTNNGQLKYTKNGTTRFMQPHIWQRIGADFTVPSGYDVIRVYILVDRREVNYLLDTTDLRELTPLLWNWAQEANREIDRIRKADIHIKVASGDPKGCSVKIRQETSQFAFGGATASDMILNSKYNAYQDFFYENFEWATLVSDLQWMKNEPKHGNLHYDKAREILDQLKENGVKVWGQSLFCGDKNRLPSWVKHLRKESLIDVMKKRVDDVLAMTGDRIDHWGVNNENLHSDLLEQKTNKVNLTMDIFRWASVQNPHLKLFLNDYDVISSGHMTQAYRSQGQLYKDTPSVSIYGLGIKVHLIPPVDLTLIKNRLNELASIGLPLWITELCVDTGEIDQQAAILDDVMRIFFSHQAVEGVIYCSVSDIGSSAPNASLTHSLRAKPNAAGLRWHKLVKQEWRTDVTLPVTTGTTRIRGFKGDYSVLVVKGGLVVQEQKFTLNSEGFNIDLIL